MIDRKTEKPVCAHCEKNREGLTRVETLAEVICCDDCVDILMEQGGVYICSACRNQAENEIKKSLPKELEEEVRNLAASLEEGSWLLTERLDKLEWFEQKNALLQLLPGGAAMEAEDSLPRTMEKGRIVAFELEQLARLYRRFLEKE